MPEVKFEKVKGHPEHGHFYEMVPDEDEMKHTRACLEHAQDNPHLYKRENDNYHLFVGKTKRQRIVSLFPFKREYKYVVERKNKDKTCTYSYASYPPRREYSTTSERNRLEHHRWFCMNGGYFKKRLFDTKEEAQAWIKSFHKENNELVKVAIGWGGDGNYKIFLKDGTSISIYN